VMNAHGQYTGEGDFKADHEIDPTKSGILQ
jgi:hypothetical protein